MARKRSRKTAPKRRVAGSDRQGLPVAEEADQVAAHGSERDAAIILAEGADPEGLAAEEAPAVEEVLQEDDEPE